MDELTRREKLIAEYERRWGPVPMWLVGTDKDGFDQLAEAIRKNQPIKTDLDDGQVA